MHASIQVKPEQVDRLAILRRRDIYRDWGSLGEKRFCILCERSISGHKILIKRDEQGIFQLHCPTPGCQGAPREWVFPGNPLTSESVYQDWWRALHRENDEPTPAAFGANYKRKHA